MQVVISGAEGCGSRINGTMGPGPLTHPLGPRTPRPRGRDCSSRDRASDLPWGAFTGQTPGAPPPPPAPDGPEPGSTWETGHPGRPPYCSSIGPPLLAPSLPNRLCSWHHGPEKR